MMRRIILGLLFFSVCSLARPQQLILRGDYPDPSVVKIGDTYWATATTSNWAPVFPILRSTDLENWESITHVFFKLPDWADYYFWAPEITYDNGKVYLYYAAHKKNGNLCIAVASADKPEGPYTDHGPLMCEEAGSIDAFPMRDKKGKLYMIWKEDGNSVNKPTPIWAMEMNEERTKLIGEKKELFRNDAGWEGNLVEGVSMIRKNDFYFAFYAAAACCGAGCSYKVGIARSRELLGPWEKYNKNPLLANNEQWDCPGHGTPVEKDGKNFFMYHAYDKRTNIFTGRQGVLSEFEFTSDGWINFTKNRISNNIVPLQNSTDDFKERSLPSGWQWSVFQNPIYELKGGELHLSAIPQGVFLAKKTLTGNYSAGLRVHAKKSSAEAGLAVIGDDNNMIIALYKNNTLTLIQKKDGKYSVLNTAMIRRNIRKLDLRVEVRNGKDISFYFKTNKGDQLLNPDKFDGSYLPPWDRAIRVGLIAKGEPGSNGVFDQFTIVSVE